MGLLGLDTDQGYYLGIDFGTTNTVVSIYDYDKDQLTPIPIDGEAIFPTVIQFIEDDEQAGKLKAIFGMEARESAMIYPESTVLSIKRMLGKEQPITVKVDQQSYDFKSEDIVAQILTYIKNEASTYMLTNMDVHVDWAGCVITVPANSTDRQKNKMKQAAGMAGFMEDQVFLRLEPAAAALTYAKQALEDKKVLVYDFGGGTFDACLLSLADMASEAPVIDLISTYGENHLGGDDLDEIMMDMVVHEFYEQTDGKIHLFDDQYDDGVSRKAKRMARVRLKEAARIAKEKLSAAASTKIVLAPFLQEPYIININMEVTREAYYNHARAYQLSNSDEVFEWMKGQTPRTLVDRTLACVTSCLELANMDRNQVDDIYLVGGSSGMPLVKSMLEEFFEKPPKHGTISPAYSISMGAAYYCYQIMNQASSGPAVTDVTVHPMGLELVGRRFLPIIESGQPIGEEGLRVVCDTPLYTNFDDLDNLNIVVYEDTSPRGDCIRYCYETGMKRLATTKLTGIKKAPAGAMAIEISFTIDRNNLLTIEATAKDTEGEVKVLEVADLYGVEA